MPNRFEQPPVYLQSGDPENEDTATMHAPGQLGARFTVVQPSRTAPGVEHGRSKRYQRVRLAASPPVAPTAGMVAWWSDEANYEVTTDATVRNRVAGVFQNAPTTTQAYTCIQIGGPAIVKLLDADMATVAVGESIIPSATNGRATRVAVGTAPTHTLLGIVASPLTTVAPTVSTVVVKLNLPETT